MVTDWRAAGAVLASIGIFGLALGLSYPLLSLLLKARGVSDTMIGINSAMTGVGMLLSCALLPRLLCLAGARRLMLAGLIGSAGTMLAFPLFDSLAVWFVLRVMLAFSLNMSFVVAEAWMNSIAADARVMGLFTTVNAAGFGLGSSLLAVTGTASWTPFVVCATIIVVGASPLVVVQRSMADEWNDGVSLRAMTQFLAATPILVLAVLAYACFDATILTLLPVYALVQGWTPEFGALAVSAFLFGMVATQMPIGWLLDRFPKVHVLVGCALLTALRMRRDPGVVSRRARALAGVRRRRRIVRPLYRGAVHFGRTLRGRHARHRQRLLRDALRRRCRNGAGGDRADDGLVGRRRPAVWIGRALRGGRRGHRDLRRTATPPGARAYRTQRPR